MQRNPNGISHTFEPGFIDDAKLGGGEYPSAHNSNSFFGGGLHITLLSDKEAKSPEATKAAIDALFARKRAAKRRENKQPASLPANYEPAKQSSVISNEVNQQPSPTIQPEKFIAPDEPGYSIIPEIPRDDEYVIVSESAPLSLSAHAQSEKQEPVAHSSDSIVKPLEESEESKVPAFKLPKPEHGDLNVLVVGNRCFVQDGERKPVELKPVTAPAITVPDKQQLPPTASHQTRSASERQMRFLQRFDRDQAASKKNAEDSKDKPSNSNKP